MGEITEIGAGVESFHIGQKVTIEPQVYCGECYPCRHGKYNLCEKLTHGNIIPCAIVNYICLIRTKRLQHCLPKILVQGVHANINPTFFRLFQPQVHGKYNLCEKLTVMGFQTTGTASEYFAVDASKVTPIIILTFLFSFIKCFIKVITLLHQILQMSIRFFHFLYFL